MEESIIESGADDYHQEGDTIYIQTAWQELANVAQFLRGKGISITSSQGEYMATNTMELTDFDKALKVHTLIETLEEDEDVESVWHNAIISPDLQAEILKYIEARRFRT